MKLYRHIRLLLLCGVVVILGMTWAMQPACAENNDPLASIKKIQEAVDQSDYATFLSLVDIDSIVHNGVVEGARFLETSKADGSLSVFPLPLALAVGNLQVSDKQQQAFVSQMLSSEIRSFLAAGISGGYFAGKPNGKVSFDKKRQMLLGKVSKKKKTLTPGSVLKQKSDSAVVSATLDDAGAGSLPVELSMSRKQGRWQVTGIHNMTDLLHSAVQKAKAKSKK